MNNQNLLQDAVNFIPEELKNCTHYTDYNLYNEFQIVCIDISKLVYEMTVRELNLQNSNIFMHYILNQNTYENQNILNGQCSSMSFNKMGVSHDIYIYINNIMAYDNIGKVIEQCIITTSHELRHAFQDENNLFHNQKELDYEIRNVELDAKYYSIDFLTRNIDTIMLYIKLYYPNIYTLIYNDIYKYEFNKILNRLQW